MQFRIRPDSWVEWLALWLNRAPVPVAQAMFGMGVARTVMAGVRLGLYAELARGPATAVELAERLGLDPRGTEHLLACLTSLGHLKRRGGRYVLKRHVRRWLDPTSPTYVGTFLEFNEDQWAWWSRLETVVRTGRSFHIHAVPPEDPFWDRYITAMYELARLAAPEVARRVRLPRRPRRLLDLGGGHGWYAVELCRRHPTLQATVFDLPGAVRVGREIVERVGMRDRVTFVTGDFLRDDLGGPYDAVLCFQVIHHLTPEQNAELFRRAYAATAPGGTLAVLDYFASPRLRRPDAALLGLHFYLTSAASTYTEADLGAWLRAGGWTRVRRVRVRRLPIQTLYEARRPG